MIKKNILSVLIISIAFSFQSIYAQEKNNPFSNIDNSKISTSFLYNKVKLPVSKIHNCNGVSQTEIINKNDWRDIYSEISQSSINNNLTNYFILKKEIKNKIRKNIFPIGIINYSYNEFKKEALKSGAIKLVNNKFVINSKDDLNTFTVFAASAIDTKQYTSLSPTFKFSSKYYFSNLKNKLLFYNVDFNDGNGFRKIKINELINVNYNNEGSKTITIHAIFENNKVLKTKFSIKLSDPKMPTPNETWTDYTADESYLGEFAQGEVGVFFGSGNSDFIKPVIIVDGFDPGDTRDIAGLWDIANQQNMVDNLTNEGYDFVIVNFYGGDDYIQKNAMLVKKVIQEINTRMTNSGTMKTANQIVVIGPSMGGLITRYAVRNMEQNGINHNIRNWIAFDSPMKGANIPLGVQHWIRFFADEAEVAGAIQAKESLSGPAAKQMLMYHYTATSSNTANSNALYTTFYNELNSMGFPQNTRITSIINGDGFGNGQGFIGGDKIIYYRYRSFLVDLDGDVWAVPNQTNTRIFEGTYDPIGWTNEEEDIYVNNTLPFDGAPGGNRNTLKELADTETDYGDITAPWDAHAFIPTISSLCLQNTSDPYFNVDANINSISTPFDRIYYPNGNQAHVAITPETYTWFYHEIINFIPEFTSVPLTIINEDDIYNYTLSSSDENEWNTLTYELIEKPNWLSFNETTGFFSGIPTNENVGISNVSVKVTDGLDESIQSFTITVNNTNDAPVITSTPNETINEDDTYTYTITATDEDATNDVLTFSAISLPDWLNFDISTKTLSGIPLNENVGINNVVLRVNDGTVDVDQSFTITVNNTNDAPTLENDLLDQNIMEGNNFTYTFAENTFSDIDFNDVLSYSASLSNNDNLPIWLSFNNTTRTFTGIPNNANSYVIKVKATDNSNESIYGTFNLIVSSNIGIENVDNDIKVYPNPALDVFYIESNKYFNKIELINVQSKIIKTISNKNREKIKISVSNLPKGIYILKAVTSNKIYLKKIILK